MVRIKEHSSNHREENFKVCVDQRRLHFVLKIRCRYVAERQAVLRTATDAGSQLHTCRELRAVIIRRRDRQIQKTNDAQKDTKSCATDASKRGQEVLDSCNLSEMGDMPGIFVAAGLQI